MPDQVESQATTGISGLVDILGRISARTRVLALRRAGDGQDDDRDAVPAGRRDGRRAILYITLSETEEELRDSAAASHGWDLGQETSIIGSQSGN